MSRLDSHLLS